MKLTLAAVCASVGLAGALMAQTALPQAVVTDSAGKLVGLLLATGQTLITLKTGQVVNVAADANGFTNANDQIALYHTSTDCTGPRYLQSGTLPDQAYALFINNASNIISPGPKRQMLTMLSIEVYNGSGFTCLQNNSTLSVAPIVVTKIDSLGLTPPFKVTYR